MMNKKIFRFLLPFAAVLLLATASAALAADYVVSGSTDVDGRYTLTERIQGKKPVYSNGTHDLAFDDSYGYWQIQPKDDVFDCLYYDEAEAASETPPLKNYAQYNGDSEGGATVAEATGTPNPELTYNKKTFIETDTDDGSLAPAPLAVTLANDTFTGDNGAVYDETKAVIANLPEGLTATLTKVSDTELSFALAGQATAHDTDVTNLNVTFTADAFAASDDVSKVTGAITSDLTIDFIRTHTVGSGKDFSTLATAIAGAGARDRLVLFGTFTETGLAIDKDLTLAAEEGASATLQGYVPPSDDSTNDRLLTIDEGASVSISQLFIQHSITTAKGSAAIWNKGTLTLSDCTLRDLQNTATSTSSYGGAIYNTGAITLDKCWFENNSCSYASAKGGAVYHAGSALAITSTTFTGNSAANGGAVFIQSSNTPASITSTTFSGNSAIKSGGGLMLYGGEAHLTHVTVYKNSVTAPSISSDGGGGLKVNSGKTLTLAGCLVAGNRDEGKKPAHDIKGAVTSDGYNLIQRVDGASGITHGTSHDLAGTTPSPLDPVLAPVLTNGVHHLLAGSPAINSASATCAPGKDQLGAARTGIPDIGAVEYVPAISGFLTVSIAGHTGLPVRDADIALEGGANGSPTTTGFFRMPVAATLSGTRALTITAPALDTLKKDLTLVKGKGHHLGILALTQTAVATQAQVDKAVVKATEGLLTQEQVEIQITNALTSVTAEKEREKARALATQRTSLLRTFDADGDGKIGLANAIRALEITAGIRRGEED
ncbi:right-handed parallel beta-helix repeat-containing protein [Desulfoluna sp.]|uniref:right-handed parallel beta-helix repeat-containing protein n=1 Tax=Desulfoluna sp. TaxID=2045199 RepID=UPI002606923E|nr:right-handed parallel beta-helix repeat-containing protein [Desulfoluna sp.]